VSLSPNSVGKADSLRLIESQGERISTPWRHLWKETRKRPKYHRSTRILLRKSRKKAWMPTPRLKHSGTSFAGLTIGCRTPIYVALDLCPNWAIYLPRLSGPTRRTGVA